MPFYCSFQQCPPYGWQPFGWKGTKSVGQDRFSWFRWQHCDLAAQDPNSKGDAAKAALDSGWTWGRTEPATCHSRIFIRTWFVKNSFKANSLSLTDLHVYTVSYPYTGRGPRDLPGILHPEAQEIAWGLSRGPRVENDERITNIVPRQCFNKYDPQGQYWWILPSKQMSCTNPQIDKCKLTCSWHDLRAISRASGCKIPILGKSLGPRGVYTFQNIPPLGSVRIQYCPEDRDVPTHIPRIGVAYWQC